MYTKSDQLKKNKTPKVKKVSKNKPTPHEQKYLSWTQNQAHYRCFVCGGYREEWHHIKFKSTDKKNHTMLIPLCKEHHHGKILSPHGTPRKWRETFTMKEQNEAGREFYYDFMQGEMNEK